MDPLCRTVLSGNNPTCSSSNSSSTHQATQQIKQRHISSEYMMGDDTQYRPKQKTNKGSADLFVLLLFLFIYLFIT